MESSKITGGIPRFRMDPRVLDESQGFEEILKSYEKFQCFGEITGFWRNSQVFYGSPGFEGILGLWRVPRYLEGSQRFEGIQGFCRDHRVLKGFQG